ncbi:MAG: hypothetical protein HYS14_09025 [Candidatus Rokubacteria bacterium]|nr:hypothetical protein [Candidatus Rokubacteria bacterium]
MGWYFRPSIWLPLKLLILAWLIWASLYHLYFSVLRAFALTRVVWAIPAAVSFVFALLAFVFVWPSLVPIMLVPAGAYFLQFPVIAAIWKDEEKTRRSNVLITIAVLVGGYIVAFVAAWIGTLLVGWIADLNPCVAWKAGVTGSLAPPPDCR